MKLVAGRKYIRRDGKVVTIINNFPQHTFFRTHPFRTSCFSNTYTPNGIYDTASIKSDLDLVAPYTGHIYQHLPKDTL